MSGEIRRLKFSDGVVVSNPEQYLMGTLSLGVFADFTAFVSAKGTAAEVGDIFFSSSLDSVYIFKSSGWQLISGNEERSGAYSLSSGVSSATIAFSSAMPDTSFDVVFSIETSDAVPIFLSGVIKNKTVNGFDILLNAPTDSTNYKINYRARKT